MTPTDTDVKYIVAGSGRSGTTWVQDVLAETHGLLPIFEPLNPKGVPDAINFAYHYFRGTEENKELTTFIDDVFIGKTNCLWTICRVPKLRFTLSNIFERRYYGYLKRRYSNIITRSLAYSQKRKETPIVKFIRANLMLEWLHNNFNAKIIFIVRHPAAVVSSQLKASQTPGGGTWCYNSEETIRLLELYKNNKRFNQDFLSRYRSIFSRKLSPAAGLTMLWCIENIHPIEMLRKRNEPVFFYENISTSPMGEFKRMNKVLGFDRLPSEELINRPSQQSSQEFQAKNSNHSHIGRWKDSLTATQLRDIHEVLTHFNVRFYSVNDPYPSPDHSTPNGFIF